MDRIVGMIVGIEKGDVARNRREIGAAFTGRAADDVECIDGHASCAARTAEAGWEGEFGK